MGFLLSELFISVTSNTWKYGIGHQSKTFQWHAEQGRINLSIGEIRKQECTHAHTLNWTSLPFLSIFFLHCTLFLKFPKYLIKYLQQTAALRQQGWIGKQLINLISITHAWNPKQHLRAISPPQLPKDRRKNNRNK